MADQSKTLSYEYRYKIIDELSAMAKIDRESIKEMFLLDDETMDILEHLSHEQREILADRFHEVFSIKSNDVSISAMLSAITIRH